MAECADRDRGQRQLERAETEYGAAHRHQPAKLELEPYTGLEPMPQIRLAWKPADNILLWSAVSRAVRAPTPVDRDLVERLTDLINDVYATAERGLWRDGSARTTADAVTGLIRGGAIAVATRDGGIVGAAPSPEKIGGRIYVSGPEAQRALALESWIHISSDGYARQEGG